MEESSSSSSSTRLIEINTPDWQDLAAEILFHIFGNLTANDLKTVALTCKHWRIVSEDNEIWQPLTQRAFPPTFARKFAVSWKDRYGKNMRTRSAWLSGKYRPTLLQGHLKDVRALQFEDRILVTASYDKSLRVWNMNTGECLRTLREHNASVVAMKMRERVAISGSSDSFLKIWDIERGICDRTLAGHWGIITAIALGPTGADSSMALTKSPSANAPVTFASGSSDRMIRIWDLRVGQFVQTLHGQRGEVECLQLDHSKLISGGADGSLKFWDLRTGGAFITVDRAHEKGIWDLQYNDELLLTCSVDKTIKVWDSFDCEPLSTLRGHSAAVLSLQFSPEDDRIVSGSSDGVVNVWSLRRFSLLRSLSVRGSSSAAQKGFGVRCLQFDHWKLVTAHFDSNVRIWSFDY